MDRARAIELLKECLEEIPHLKGLHHDNREYKLWCKKVINIIKAGLDADDENEFLSGQEMYLDWSWIDVTSEELEQEHYLESLAKYEINLESIIEKYELGLEVEPATVAEPLKAFIAHGGESAALNKLCSFLEALGLEPLVVETQPSEGRLTETQVDEYMKQADCAIILATYGHIVDEKTGKKHPRLNVVDELGRCRKVFPDRTILLLEKGVDLPSNVSGIVYEHFTKQNMDKAFIKVAKELRAFGLIEAVKG